MVAGVGGQAPGALHHIVIRGIALAVDRLMLTGADITRKLNLTPSGVSRLVVRGQGEPALRKLEETIFVQ